MSSKLFYFDNIYRYNVAKKKRYNIEKGKLKKNQKAESDRKSDNKNNGNKKINKKSVGDDDDDDDDDEDVVNITLDGDGDDDNDNNDYNNNDNRGNNTMASQHTKGDQSKNRWLMILSLHFSSLLCYPCC